MSYGTLTLVDGTYTPSSYKDEGLRRGLVRINGALQPPAGTTIKPGGTTFLVDLHYHDRAYAYGSGKEFYATEIGVSYSRSYKRLASGGNTLKDAKEFISRFAGCDEAHKLRKRIIATARTKASISGMEFRFPLETANSSYLCVRNKNTDARSCIIEKRFNKRIEEIIGGPYNSPNKCLANCSSELSSSSSEVAP